MEAERLDYAILFALLTFVLWGSTNFLIKFGTENDLARPPMVAVMWMTVGVIGVAFFLYLWSTGRFDLVLNRWILLPITAGTFLGLGLLSFTYAVSLGHTGSIAAIATANSAFTTLLAFLILKEGLDLRQLGGIGAIIFGLVLIATSH